jgi:hypothetical protein
MAPAEDRLKVKQTRRQKRRRIIVHGRERVSLRRGTSPWRLDLRVHACGGHDSTSVAQAICWRG